jgi:hypothetical protein
MSQIFPGFIKKHQARMYWRLRKIKKKKKQSNRNAIKGNGLRS